MPDSSPQVSVIVIIHNSLPALTGCLESIEAAAAPASFELIVVDNGSTDEGLSEATRCFPGCTTIHNPTNRGFAAACNQGAGVAVGEYLLFLNPDVRLDAGAISVLVEAASDRERSGLVSGRLRNPDGTFQAICRRFPTMTNMVFSRGSVLARTFTFDRDLNRYSLPDSRETTEVPAVAATFVTLGRQLFFEVGGFDSRFYMYMEDTDLSLRLHEAGYHNLFVPAAGGIHDWGCGSDTGRVRRLRYHHLSVWKYFLKHFPNGFSVLVLPLLLAVNFVLRASFPDAREGGRAQ